MGAVIALPFLLLFLWFIGAVFYSMMGWWAILLIPVILLLMKVMAPGMEQQRKAKLMRKQFRREQRYENEAALAAEWDRRHGK
jgi:hypothetical protein